MKKNFKVLSDAIVLNNRFWAKIVIIFLNLALQPGEEDRLFQSLRSFLYLWRL